MLSVNLHTTLYGCSDLTVEQQEQPVAAVGKWYLQSHSALWLQPGVAETDIILCSARRTNSPLSTGSRGEEGAYHLRRHYALIGLIRPACISMCIFTARARTWKLAARPFPLSHTGTGASSVCISMAADNHLMELAEPSLRGPDRSPWPTYDRGANHCKSHRIRASACRSSQTV